MTKGSGIPTESPTVTPLPLARLYTVTTIQVFCSSTRQKALNKKVNNYIFLIIKYYAEIYATVKRINTHNGTQSESCIQQTTFPNITFSVFSPRASSLNGIKSNFIDFSPEVYDPPLYGPKCLTSNAYI